MQAGRHAGNKERDSQVMRTTYRLVVVRRNNGNVTDCGLLAIERRISGNDSEVDCLHHRPGSTFVDSVIYDVYIDGLC